VQVAQTLKVSYRNPHIRVRIRFFRDGSVITETARSYCDSVSTEVELESDETPERVAKLIRMAEASCFTLAALRNVVPCEVSATMNGESLDLKP
jgi:hypothetical protein